MCIYSKNHNGQLTTIFWTVPTNRWAPGRFQGTVGPVHPDRFWFHGTVGPVQPNRFRFRHQGTRGPGEPTRGSQVRFKQFFRRFHGSAVRASSEPVVNGSDSGTVSNGLGLVRFRVTRSVAITTHIICHSIQQTPKITYIELQSNKLQKYISLL